MQGSWYYCCMHTRRHSPRSSLLDVDEGLYSQLSFFISFIYSSILVRTKYTRGGGGSSFFPSPVLSCHDQMLLTKITFHAARGRNQSNADLLSCLLNFSSKSHWLQPDHTSDTDVAEPRRRPVVISPYGTMAAVAVESTSVISVLTHICLL